MVIDTMEIHKKRCSQVEKPGCGRVSDIGWLGKEKGQDWSRGGCDTLWGRALMGYGA